MKQFFLKITGLAILILLVHEGTYSQEIMKDSSRDNIQSSGGYDEVIIRTKGEKGSKVTVEIKDGKVLLNGKSPTEFQDDNIKVMVRKISDDEKDFEIMIPPMAPMPPMARVSPYRGGSYNFNMDKALILSDSKRAFLGVSSSKADNGGAEVQEVTKGSPAEKIGLRKGDVITRVDEIKIADPEALVEAVHKYQPESKAVITYLRDGKQQQATAVLARSKNVNFKYKYIGPGQEDMHMNLDGPDNFNLEGPDNFKFQNAPHTFFFNTEEPRIGIRAQDTESGTGVKVLEVDDESPADKAGLKEGDIITQFDGKEVNSVSSLAGLARAAKTKPSLKVKFTRAGKSQEAVIKIPRKLNSANL